MEIEASWRHSCGLDISGNLTVSQNRFDDYLEYADSVTVNDYSGNSIAGFPARMANVTLGYRRGPARLALSVVDVGVQYLDNSEDNRKNPSLRETPGYQRKRVEASTVLNGVATLGLGNGVARSIGAESIDLDLRGFNLTNLRYESAGYVYAEVPYYFPSAMRHFYVSLRAAF